jgi:hypothetical protein
MSVTTNDCLRQELGTSQAYKKIIRKNGGKTI